MPRSYEVPTEVLEALERTGESVEVYHSYQDALRDMAAYTDTSPAYVFAVFGGAMSGSGAELFEHAVRPVIPAGVELTEQDDQYVRDTLDEFAGELKRTYEDARSRLGLEQRPLEQTYTDRVQRARLMLRLWKDVDTQLVQIMPTYESRLESVLGPPDGTYLTIAHVPHAHFIPAAHAANEEEDPR